MSYIDRLLKDHVHTINPEVKIKNKIVNASNTFRHGDFSYKHIKLLSLELSDGTFLFVSLQQINTSTKPRRNEWVISR